METKLLQRDSPRRRKDISSQRSKRAFCERAAWQVKGERKVIIEDGKAMIDVPESVWEVWRAYEARNERGEEGTEEMQKGNRE